MYIYAHTPPIPKTIHHTNPPPKNTKTTHQQDARTPFYVLARGEQGAGAGGAINSSALPQVFFIEASANAAAAHQV